MECSPEVSVTIDYRKIGAHLRSARKAKSSFADAGCIFSAHERQFVWQHRTRHSENQFASALSALQTL